MVNLSASNTFPNKPVNMAAYRARLAEFHDILNSDKIDLKRLRGVCFEGCSHEKSIRSKSWKILLNYLPLDVKEWDQHLQKQRRVYQQFINEMIIQPGQNSTDGERADVTMEDHPLSLNPDSQWSQYFKDNDMLIQIDKDCRRLCPDLSFFQSATNYPCKELVSPEKKFNSLRKRVEHCALKSENVTKNRLGITLADVRRPRAKSQDYVALEEGQEAHWEVAERILFIYGKLNPGQGYVQGMNEILGPIYYSFAADPDSQCKENAEPDAFWCFTNLMSEIRDNFIKTLDHSECGIDMLMRRYMLMLKEKDTSLYLKLEQQEIRPQFYAFRWLTLLLSQEFPLPEVLRLWDSLFADINRFDFLICVCCAILIMVRDKLFKGDFSYNMKLLQNYPATDVNDIIAKAVELNER